MFWERIGTEPLLVKPGLIDAHPYLTPADAVAALTRVLQVMTMGLPQYCGLWVSSAWST